MPVEKIKRAVPIREQVYERLRQAILSGVLEPGVRIVEEDICKQYHVSRTPVRESLRKLENEKLLIHVPNKGAVVAPWSISDVEEIFRLRLALEKLVISVIIEKMNPLMEKKLTNMIQHTEKVIEGTAGETHRLFEEFHPLVHQMAEMPRLFYMLKGLSDYLYRVHHLLRRNPQRRQRAYEDHLSIARALLARDQEEAERQMEHHLNSGYQFFLSQIEEKKHDNVFLTKS